MLREEAAGFAKPQNLLLIELHIACVSFGKPVAGHLAEAEGGRSVWVVRLWRTLVQAEAVLAEDQRCVVFGETGELNAWLSLP